MRLTMAIFRARGDQGAYQGLRQVGERPEGPAKRGTDRGRGAEAADGG